MSRKQICWTLVSLAAVVGVAPWLATVLGQSTGDPTAPPSSSDAKPAFRFSTGSAAPAGTVGIDFSIVTSADLDLRGQEEQAAQRVRQNLERYKGTDAEADKEKIKAELAAAIENQFVLQQKRRDAEIKQVEARVKKLRDLLDKRETQKRKIVDSRLDQLIRDAEGLGWTAPGEQAEGRSENPAINVFAPRGLNISRPRPAKTPSAGSASAGSADTVPAPSTTDNVPRQ